MKSLKIATFAIASAALSFGGYCAAADEAAPAGSAASQSDNKDRSYVDEMSGKKATIFQTDKSGANEVQLTYKSSTDKDFVFVDSTGGELNVPKNTTSYKFIVKPDNNWQRVRSAYSAGNWNEVIVYLRPMVYPLIPLTAFPEDTCKLHGFVEMYLSALINADRLTEASSFVLALPLGEVPASLLSTAISVGDALAKAGRVKEAIAISDRLNFDAKNMAAMDDMMDFLGTLRKSGATKVCALWYTKLGNLADNPRKSECTMWMIYCDLQLGNKMSAEVYLSSIKAERTSEAFSLLQMIKGMIKASAEKPNLGEALDLYAEGIVFGSLTSPWMPELLYDAGMTYKKMGKFVPANEIFLQIAALYPSDTLAKKGLKEIVKVEPKAKKQVADSEDEDEEEDEE